MKTFRDKNGFQVEPGEDWNNKKSDETIKFMRKPKNNSSINQRIAELHHIYDDGPKPNYPNEATPQQMAELKKKIDKYKDIHFPKKPFSQPKLKDRPVRKPGAVPPKTKTIKLDPLPPIDFDLISKPFVRDPETEAAERRFLESVRRNEEEKRRNATSGLAGLIGGDPTIK